MWSKPASFKKAVRKCLPKLKTETDTLSASDPHPRHGPSLAQSIAIGSWTNDNVETLRSTPCCWSLPENTTIHHGFSSLKKRRKHRQRKKAWIQCSAETWGQGYLFTPVYAMIQNLPKFHVNVSWHLFQDFDILWTSRCWRFPAHLHQHPPHPRTTTWQLITVWQSFGSTDTVRPVPQARLVGKVLVLRHETAICTIQHQTNSWYILPFWKNWSIWSGRIFDFLIQLQNFRWSTSQPNPVSQPFAQECNFKNTLLWNPADKLTTP